MAKTAFIKAFEGLKKLGNYLHNDDWENFYQLYKADEYNNRIFVLNSFKDYLDDGIGKYGNIISFIEYLGNIENFTDNWVINKLKELLNSSIDKNIENYFYYLRALFAVNRNDVPFYKEQFDILQENGKLYHDINQYFSQIFQQLNINDYFIISLEKTITDKESYSFYTKEGFKYLISLEKREFKKYFLELLEFFGDDKQKGKLVKWNEYNSILDYEAKIIIQNAPPISKIEMLSFYLLNYISDAR